VNVYTCTNFKGHWPVGTAAVVVATDSLEAASILNNELREKHSLPGNARSFDMIELNTSEPLAVVLNDGDY